ncbi:alpha/beta hydrolase family protein [Paenimyroides ummariense]|nr:prolyl oligopeptidase family serine peptidase [Paenimyroides ummariense]
MTFCPSFGQNVDNKPETLRPAYITESGKIAVYFSDTENNSTCIIHLIDTGEKIVLKNVDNRMLVTDYKAVFYSYVKKQMYVVDLISKKTDTVADVEAIEVLEAVNKIIYHTKADKMLTILNVKSGTSEKFLDVDFYNVDREFNKLVFSNDEAELFLMDLKKEKTVKYDAGALTDLSLRNAKWDTKGQKVYLFALDDDNVHLYEISTKLNKVGQYPVNNERESLEIDTYFTSVMVLPNDKMVIGVKSVEKVQPGGADVEIWNGNINGFPAAVNFYKEHRNQLAIIDIKTGLLTSLMEKGKIMGYHIDHIGNIYRYEIFENDDTSLLNPPINLYKYDFDKNSFSYLSKFSSVLSNLLKYKTFPNLVYYKDNHWNYFDLNSGKGESISVNSDGKFYSDEHEYYNITGTESLNGPLEWKGRGFYLNDQKDIWYYDWKSKKIIRKTNSKKQEKNYRLCNCNYDLNHSVITPFELVTKPNNDLIITWNAGLHEFEGIDLLKEDGTITPLVWDKAHYSQIKRFKDYLIYVKEKVNVAPSVYIYNLKSKEEILLHKSNTWDTDVTDVKSEHFYWYNENGNIRGGIVRFPKNYNEKDSTKYPVVVSIYEQKFKAQNIYVPPTDLSVTNINFREYTADDYFVIEPDIYYEIGETGQSALKCINETIDFLAKVFPLDTERMGIYGHSYGGYETNYVITQTPRFKAAISSAGVADAVSMYLTYSFDLFIPDVFRFETHQWRFGKSFFDDQELYIRNSPVYHAKNISTPLLLITGTKDYVINWQQSLYMFTAMKRLGKEVQLLLYNNEDHSISDPKNQIDVSRRTKEWFDFYLKRRTEPVWLN